MCLGALAAQKPTRAMSSGWACPNPTRSASAGAPEGQRFGVRQTEAGADDVGTPTPPAIAPAAAALTTNPAAAAGLAGTHAPPPSRTTSWRRSPQPSSPPPAFQRPSSPAWLPFSRRPCSSPARTGQAPPSRRAWPPPRQLPGAAPLPAWRMRVLACWPPLVPQPWPDQLWQWVPARMPQVLPFLLVRLEFAITRHLGSASCYIL